ncbi:MAG: AAA family ATPase [Pseudomonadota bacterium]
MIYSELNPPPIDEIPPWANCAQGVPLTDGLPPPSQSQSRITVKAVTGDEFLAMAIPEREYFLGRWLPVKGLCMVHAWRGVGKTMFALSVAKSVATGERFARWAVRAARPVVYVDGEMAATQMKDRLQAITGEQDDLSNITLVADDLQAEGLPDLTSETGQRIIEGFLKPESLLILDNISCLFRDGADENDARSWKSAAEWLRKLRREGHSVLLVHHSGKGGAQRGTSKREDILDTVIHLKRSEDYSPAEGAVFEIHFEKCRGAFGDDVEPFKLHYHADDGAVAHWTTSEIVDHDYQAVVDGVKAGKSVRDIAEDTGISRSEVGRLRQRAKAAGDA